MEALQLNDAFKAMLLTSDTPEGIGTSTTNSEPPHAKANEVLDLDELFLAILLELPLQTIILATQVCRRWRSVILGSRKVQQRLREWRYLNAREAREQFDSVSSQVPQSPASADTIWFIHVDTKAGILVTHRSFGREIHLLVPWSPTGLIQRLPTHAIKVRYTKSDYRNNDEEIFGVDYMDTAGNKVLAHEISQSGLCKRIFGRQYSTLSHFDFFKTFYWKPEN